MLTYQNYIVIEKKWDALDTFILKLKPIDTEIPNYKPGQYVVVKNPTYRDKNEEHIFSLTSSPYNKSYIELCIKIFGPWTKYLSKIVKEDPLLISSPSGNFIWDDSITNAVFLVGGVGISPIISMLRYIDHSKLNPNLTLLYCGQSSKKVAYTQELAAFKKKLPLKVVYIYSEPSRKLLNKHYGFLTKEIVLQECNLAQNPTIFYCGPDNFIKTTNNILKQLKISHEYIKSEARE